MYDSLEYGGKLICNYPSSPRKMVLTATELAHILKSIFGGSVERVGGSALAPLWIVHKPYVS